ncbi:hypothetical protein GCM10009716_37620 [Streptomyces sodiiphilus]|uniref:DUF397 domain-containing protein n=1 Tax=Streptomyces sodiiphilus TaxID=226217 RepID=A0ABN2PML4_9ACTN
MSALPLTGWRKSTRSNPAGGDCVEVAVRVGGAVPVRDSKRPGGPVLLIPVAAWESFVCGLRRAEAVSPGSPHGAGSRGARQVGMAAVRRRSVSSGARPSEPPMTESMSRSASL